MEEETGYRDRETMGGDYCVVMLKLVFDIPFQFCEDFKAGCFARDDVSVSKEISEFLGYLVDFVDENKGGHFVPDIWGRGGYFCHVREEIRVIDGKGEAGVGCEMSG
jgi:hypothetical protein